MILNQKLDLPILREKQVSLFVKREDLNHPKISGNKFRKLKYNIEKLKALGEKRLVTFGGAYSNHIAATAYAGKILGVQTTGIIRGEELQEKWKENPTLSAAHENGMQFVFVSRASYKSDNRANLLSELHQKLGSFYFLPEGGTNSLAVKGCEEILVSGDKEFEVVSCSIGTGGTIAGIINSTHSEQTVLGFPALKGEFLKEDICKFVKNTNWQLCKDYHFGGYGKINEDLVNFINLVFEKTGIPLDPVYTGKMIYGLVDLTSKNYFKPKTKILAIHTGGLQGVSGMNQYLKKKNLPLLKL